MHHLGGPGPLVEVVHVLGNHVHQIVFLQCGNGQVGGIGAGITQLLPALVVKVQHQRAVTVPALDGGHVVHIVLFPKASRVTEGGETAFGRYAGAG